QRALLADFLGHDRAVWIHRVQFFDVGSLFQYLPLLRCGELKGQPHKCRSQEQDGEPYPAPHHHDSPEADEPEADKEQFSFHVHFTPPLNAALKSSLVARDTFPWPLVSTPIY